MGWEAVLGSQGKGSHFGDCAGQRNHASTEEQSSLTGQSGWRAAWRGLLARWAVTTGASHQGRCSPGQLKWGGGRKWQPGGQP